MRRAAGDLSRFSCADFIPMTPQSVAGCQSVCCALRTNVVRAFVFYRSLRGAE